MLRALLCSLVVFVSAASVAQAQTRTCEELFGPSEAKPVAVATLRAKLNELTTVKDRIFAPPFRLPVFDQALADYRAQTPNEFKQPQSREETLALLTHLSQLDGRDPYDLELMARSRNPQTLSRLVKTFGKIDATSFSPSQIDDIFEKLMRYREPRVQTLKNVWNLGFGEMKKTTLRQWTTKEIASHDLKTTLDRLGLLQNPEGLKAWRDHLRADPNVVHAISSTSFNLFLMLNGGLPLSLPEHSSLRVTRLDPVLREIIETEGFDAAYPLLKERYGRKAGFDQAFFWARRAATTAMLTYMIVTCYPALMQSLAPGLVDEHDGAWKMTKLVFEFYFNLAKDVVSYELEKQQAKARAVHAHPAAVSPPKKAADRPKPVPQESDDEKPLAKPMEVRSFDDDLKIHDAKVKTTGTTEEDKALQATLDAVSNASFEDPTEH